MRNNVWGSLNALLRWLLMAICCVSAAPGGMAVSQDKLTSCVADFVQDIDGLYNFSSGLIGSNATIIRQQELTKAAVNFSLGCLGLQVDVARAVRIMVPMTGMVALLQRHADEFEAATGVRVILNPVLFYEVGKEVLQELTAGISDFSDGWVIDPAITGQVASLNGFKSLDDYIPEDASLQWNDISRFFRTASAIYDGKVVAIPLDGDLMLMYYRRDLFLRYNLSVPVTWDEFVQLAEQMNGTDTDGDGVGDLYGACLDIHPSICKANFILIAMAAPYIQYRGTAQGVFYDPDTMEPLFNNAAMARAFELYVRLFAVQPPTPSCDASNAAFRNRTCLLTINWGDEFRANAGGATYHDGLGADLGVAALPGATEVLDRPTGRMVPCTSRYICPYAIYTRLANGTFAFVNFAPYSAFGGWAGAISTAAPSEYQKKAYKFFSYVANSKNSWHDVSDPRSGIDPYRRSQLAPDPENLDRWRAAGFDLLPTRSYLATVNDALESGNVVLDLRLQSSVSPRLLLEAALRNLTWNRTANPNLTVPVVLGRIQTQLADGLVGSMPLTELRRQYCKLIGCVVQQPEKQVPRQPEDSTSHSQLIPLFITVPVGIVLLALAVVLLMWWRHAHRRNLFSGGVKAPGAGPATTLLITDIESSTALWELLPEHVMGNAIEMHHRIVRRALSQYAGYESATEGDSFICAFHTASEAVQCALHIQQELLTATWPPELLACQECGAASEVYLTPSAVHSEVMDMLVPYKSVQQPARPGEPGYRDNATHHRQFGLRILRKRLWSRTSGGGGGGGTSGSVGRTAATADDGISRHFSEGAIPVPDSGPSRPIGGPGQFTSPSYGLELAATGYNRLGGGGGSGGLLSVEGPQPAGDSSSGLPSAVYQRLTSMSSRLGGGGGGGGGEGSYRPPSDTAFPREAPLSIATAPLPAVVMAAPAPAEIVSWPMQRAGSRALPYSMPSGQLTGSIAAIEESTTGVSVSGATRTVGSARVLQDCIVAAWRLAAEAFPVIHIQLGSSRGAGGPGGGGAAAAGAGGLDSGTATAAPLSSSPPTGGSAAAAAAAATAARRATWRRGRTINRTASVCAFRGLRVRIGMASGVPEPSDVSYNAAEARFHYNGIGMRLTRAVQGAAAGGMVLLSDSTFAQQRQEQAAAHIADAADAAASGGSISNSGSSSLSGVLWLHMGQHLLHPDLAPQQVYQAVSPGLSGRLALFPPITARRCFAAGVLSAPVRRAAIAFVHVVGASSLLAWDAAVARTALKLLEEDFAAKLCQSYSWTDGGVEGNTAPAEADGSGQDGCWDGGCRGYIVEAYGGLLLASFSHPGQAVRCCLALLDAMPGLPWPAALLENALCEELTVARLDSTGAVSREVLFRGLRIKAGLDYGAVHATINSATGRVSYRGRVMNRASRISSNASSGQVLCSRDLYDAAAALAFATHGSSEQLPFSTISLGASALKGLPEPVELLLCRPWEPLSARHLPVRISVAVSEPSNSEQRLVPPLPPLQQPQPQPQQQQQQQRQRQLQTPAARLQESVSHRPVRRLSALLRMELQVAASPTTHAPISAASDAPLHVSTPRVSFHGLPGDPQGLLVPEDVEAEGE
ncbi:hypothetical protein VaNZ11_016406 [Volvox africanus]|uniref:Guanylate cyclase domain-containing protein n=1 Tax=Volvox africanus TaxID=51714 RepID=A0ABQ5SPC5_9CHLO|nr:hypothetical protein VaNZ11_016406 [Volvox africanus]